MLPERSSARRNSKSKNGKSSGSSARHTASSAPSIPKIRSTRIASAPGQLRPPRALPHGEHLDAEPPEEQPRKIRVGLGVCVDNQVPIHPVVELLASELRTRTNVLELKIEHLSEDLFEREAVRPQIQNITDAGAPHTGASTARL